MALHAITYASQATPSLTKEQLEALVKRAAAHNHLAGVTGLLLFDGVRFLQYIEGPEDGVTMVYSRIMNSTSHSNVIELARGHVIQRRMPYWPMRWLSVAEGDLKAAAFSDWTNFVVHKVGSGLLPTGLERLCTLAAPHVRL